MRLVGASNFTIKTPFIIEGMILGAFGSISLREDNFLGNALPTFLAYQCQVLVNLLGVFHLFLLYRLFSYEYSLVYSKILTPYSRKLLRGKLTYQTKLKLNF